MELVTFDQLFLSHRWPMCSLATYLLRQQTHPLLNWICITNASAATRAASFKSLYRKRAIPPYSCAHLAHSRFRYST